MPARATLLEQAGTGRLRVLVAAEFALADVAAGAPYADGSPRTGEGRPRHLSRLTSRQRWAGSSRNTGITRSVFFW